MDEEKIERIRGYIERTVPTGSFHPAYDISMEELIAISHLFSPSRPIRDNLIDIVILAFYYGRAKGVRGAKAAQKREARV